MALRHNGNAMVPLLCTCPPRYARAFFVRLGIDETMGEAQASGMEASGMTRQPVLDRHRRLVGYEYRFRGPQSGSMESGLSRPDIRRLFGERTAFVPAPERPADCPLGQILPPAQLVLQFATDSSEPSAVAERLGEAKAAGFHTAVTVGGDAESALPAGTDFLHLDSAQLSEEALGTWIAAAQSAGTRLVAANVHSLNQFRQLLRRGFHYFQGPFFTRPVRLSQEPIPAQKSTLLRIFRLLEADAEVGEIEALFKLAPELSYRLLKLLNSAAFALPRRIQSIRQALVMLGRRNIRKWVAVLLYTGEAGDFSSPLLAEAVIRGRMMELATQAAGRDSAFADAAQIAGTLSVAPGLLNRPMEQVVEELQLETAISDALLHGSGDLGALLHQVQTMREQGCLSAPPSAGTLAAGEADLVFYEQKATLEQATLELENAGTAGD